MYVPTQKSNRDDIIRDKTLVIPDNDTQTIEHKKKILVFLEETTAAYLAEIVWETSVSEYQTKAILAALAQEKLIEPIKVHPTIPDTRLVARVTDQSLAGHGGYENFSRKRWFGITWKGRAWLRETTI